MALYEFALPPTSKDAVWGSGRLFKTYQREIEYQWAEALNAALVQVQDDNTSRMDDVFEGGATPFTKKGMVVKRWAKKGDYRGVLGHKGRQEAYLSDQERGGTVGPSGAKRNVFVPQNIRLNKYGGFPRNSIKKLLHHKDEIAFIGKPKRYGNASGDDTYGIWVREGRMRSTVGKKRGVKAGDRPILKSKERIRLAVALKGAVTVKPHYHWFEFANRRFRDLLKDELLLSHKYAFEKAMFGTKAPRRGRMRKGR